MRFIHQITVLFFVATLTACGGGGGGGEPDYSDPDYGRANPPFQASRFVLTDNEGDIHDVVYDNNTGLTWHRNGWLPKYVEGWTGTGDGLDRSQLSEFIEIMNSNEVGGYTDWRLPTPEELYDFWAAGVTNDNSVFEYAFHDESYWTSKSAPEKCAYGECWTPRYVIYFFTGSLLTSVGTADYHVWPVRG